VVPPNGEPFGRKFEQAWNAALVFALPTLELPGKPPGGFVPPGLPFGGAPSPKVGADTPCFFRQLSNFLIAAVGVLAEGLVDAEATPPLANTAPERARASSTPGVERYLAHRLIEVVVFFMATVWRANLDET